MLKKIPGTVWLTSMNSRLFKKSILLIFSGRIWATEKTNTNFRILIPRAFQWAYQIFTPTNSAAEIRQNMILSLLLFDLSKKSFAFHKFWNFYPQNIFIWVLALNHKETFQYLVYLAGPQLKANTTWNESLYGSVRKCFSLVLSCWISYRPFCTASAICNMLSIQQNNWR